MKDIFLNCNNSVPVPGFNMGHLLFGYETVGVLLKVTSSHYNMSAIFQMRLEMCDLKSETAHCSNLLGRVGQNFPARLNQNHQNILKTTSLSKFLE